jgi:hypothetical protein
MNPGLTLKRVRTSAIAMAGSGALCSLVFALVLYGSYPSIFFEKITWNIPPFVIIAVAGRLSRVRSLALVALLAGLSVLVLEAYTFIDLVRSRGVINDIELPTAPWQWLLALLAFVSAFIGFMMWKIRDVPASL